MKIKKLYILTTLLIAVIIFGTAAICNRCSIVPPTTVDKAVEETSITAITTTEQTIAETSANATETPAVATPAEIETTPTQKEKQTIYTNTQHGFSFSLPSSWEGYSIVNSEWEGNPVGSGTVIEQGPIISIRNPKWTQENPYQDIPIMVFTIAQWDSPQQEKFHIGAAPIGPTELGRNTKYVFALPARYNFAFPEGYEEVEKILEGNPLKAF